MSVQYPQYSVLLADWLTYQFAGDVMMPLSGAKEIVERE